jgi:hypothetical protein
MGSDDDSDYEAGSEPELRDEESDGVSEPEVEILPSDDEEKEKAVAGAPVADAPNQPTPPWPRQPTNLTNQPGAARRQPNQPTPSRGGGLVGPAVRVFVC